MPSPDKDKNKNKKPARRSLSGKLPPTPLPREAMTNTKVRDLSFERDARCVPLAHELVKMMAGMPSMPVGNFVTEKNTPIKSVYLPVVKEFLKLLIDKNVKIVEVAYIFALSREALQFVSDAIDETANQQMNRVTEMVYGLKLNDYDEITLKDLNEVVMRKPQITAAVRKALDEKPEIKDNSEAGS